MITYEEKWHYLAAKKFSALLRGVKLRHGEGFYCINCFHSYSTKYKLEKHYNKCKNHNYCHVEMPNEDNKVLKYSHGEKSMKHPFIIYSD